MILKKAHVNRMERHGLDAGTSDLQTLINSHEELRQLHDEDVDALEQERAKSGYLERELNHERGIRLSNLEIKRALVSELEKKESDIRQLSDEHFLLQLEYETFKRHVGPFLRAWAWVRGLICPK